MKEKSNNSFKELIVWKKSRELRLKTIDMSRRFPEHEKFKLNDQITRSSRSICACIAEGHGRFSYKDQLHFCVMARGSLSETHNHFIEANDCKYISDENLHELEIDVAELNKVLNGYISYLRKNTIT